MASKEGRIIIITEKDLSGTHLSVPGFPRQRPQPRLCVAAPFLGNVTSQTLMVCLACVWGSSMRPSLPQRSLNYVGRAICVDHQAG